MDIKLADNLILPNGALVFAFIASVILTIIKIIELLIKAFTKAKLEVRLTREVFLRLLNTGESIYIDTVLISNDKSCLIKDIKASLEKIDGPRKTFPLRLAQLGEKYRNFDGSIKFSFYSTSPLAFIPQNIPLRQIYIFEHESYADNTKTKFSSFSNSLFQLKAQAEEMLRDNPNLFQDLNNEPVESFLKSVRDLVERTCNSILDDIQLEGGKYKLTATLTYQPKTRISLINNKTTSSAIEFNIEEAAKEIFRNSLRAYLDNVVSNLLLQKNITANLPEYAPINVIEVK
jgi:hypothetical protein